MATFNPTAPVQADQGTAQISENQNQKAQIAAQALMQKAQIQSQGAMQKAQLDAQQQMQLAQIEAEKTNFENYQQHQNEQMAQQAMMRAVEAEQAQKYRMQISEQDKQLEFAMIERMEQANAKRAALFEQASRAPREQRRALLEQANQAAVEADGYEQAMSYAQMQMNLAQEGTTAGIAEAASQINQLREAHGELASFTTEATSNAFAMAAREVFNDPNFLASGRGNVKLGTALGAVAGGLAGIPGGPLGIGAGAGIGATAGASLAQSTAGPVNPVGNKFVTGTIDHLMKVMPQAAGLNGRPISGQAADNLKGLVVLLHGTIHGDLYNEQAGTPDPNWAATREQNLAAAKHYAQWLVGEGGMTGTQVDAIIKTISTQAEMMSDYNRLITLRDSAEGSEAGMTGNPLSRNALRNMNQAQLSSLSSAMDITSRLDDLWGAHFQRDIVEPLDKLDEVIRSLGQNGQPADTSMLGGSLQTDVQNRIPGRLGTAMTDAKDAQGRLLNAQQGQRGALQRAGNINAQMQTTPEYDAQEYLRLLNQ